MEQNNKKVVLPEGVENIYYDAFYCCEALEEIVFPDSLEFIGANAFDGCESIKNLIIPRNVYEIYDEAFSWCTNLRTVKFDKGSKLHYIGKRCFDSCESLTSVHVPDSVEGIGSYAFCDCKNLKDIRLPKIRISKSVFEGTGLSSNDIKNSKIQLTDDDESERNTDQSIEEWYMGSDGEIDNDKFAEKLENLVRNDFDVSEYFEEPSIQGFAGADIISIKLNDGSEYSFSFSWREMQEAIYSDGPEAAANYYFNEIKEGIESGSASTDTPTL